MVDTTGRLINTPEVPVDINATDRIHRSNYKASPRSRPRKGLAWNAREFIAWDGEGTTPEIGRVSTNLPPTLEEFLATAPWDREKYYGDAPAPQPYVLLANSKGDHICKEGGIDTVAALEFILHTKQHNRDSTFVGFGFNYDVAQILKDLPERKLYDLYKSNRCKWRRYNITWRPSKWFTVSHHPTKRSATIYDVFGFFQSSFVTACEKYLGRDYPALRQVSAGKDARNTFAWYELESLILPYCKLELKMLVEIMNILREDFHNVGFDLNQWYGPGVVANKLFRKYNIKSYMSRDIPPEVQRASQIAYAGGWFEPYWLGRHQGAVYEYDIRSAYPAAAIKLPDLSKGSWELTETFQAGSFGVWYINYRSSSTGHEPQPLFCRSPNGLISHPKEVSGWYWTPEAELVPDSVCYGYVFKPETATRPFSFIEGIYNDRRDYKARNISAERALKLILNSIYGKLAQTIGGKDGPPTWHQLEWAGYITSYTRAKLYRAMQLNPNAIIAAETDAIFSKEPLDLEVGSELGQWELTTFTEITYLQSGFYYAVTQEGNVICRYRGLDRDRKTQQPTGLPYRTVLAHLRFNRSPEYGRTYPLTSSTTRFINLGLGLTTNSVYRSWETKNKSLAVDNRPRKSKRYHLNSPKLGGCAECEQGYTLADKMHRMKIGGYSGPSAPHHLPWIDEDDEMYRKYMERERAERWQ